MMIYSRIKKIIPQSLRSMVRDLDIAYQERLKEIDHKNQRISQLEASLQEALKEIETIKHQYSYKQINSNIDDVKLLEEEYDKLSKAGVFIIGNARSGTSILCDCLNLSPDVFLLGEANLYLHDNIDNFVEFFNNQHIEFKNHRFKGTFIPPSRLPEKGGLAFLSRMHKHYQFVGEKIAFGPRGNINNQSPQELFFRFHATYFYFSHNILIMRRPTEAIWSMAKMFTDADLSLLFECWLRTLQIQIDIFHCLPNSYVLFFENLTNEAVLNLCSLIGINIRIPQKMFREENQYSLLANNDIPDELSRYSNICLACEEIYQRVKDEFDIETFKLKETAANYGCARYGFSSSIQKKIEETLNALSNLAVS